MAGVLEDVTVVVHILTLLYIGFGGFLGWRWPKSLFGHVLFAAWGISIILGDVLPCPLTYVQDQFRHMQGLGSLPAGFNEYYIYGEIFPHSWVPVVATGAIAVIVISYIGAWACRWKRRAAASAGPARPVGLPNRERASRSDRVGRP